MKPNQKQHDSYRVILDVIHLSTDEAQSYKHKKNVFFKYLTSTHLDIS